MPHVPEASITAAAVTTLAPVGAGDVDAERHLVAADGDQPVASGAGDADDPVAVAELDPCLGRESRGQGREVALDPVVAGGVRRRVGTRPAGLGQQRHRDRVDQLGPRREEPHVPPLRDRRPGGVARLEHDGRDPAGVGLGGGGEPGRTGSDHDQRQVGVPVERRRWSGGRVGIGLLLDRGVIDGYR